MGTRKTVKKKTAETTTRSRRKAAAQSAKNIDEAILRLWIRDGIKHELKGVKQDTDNLFDRVSALENEVDDLKKEVKRLERIPLRETEDKLAEVYSEFAKRAGDEYTAKLDLLQATVTARVDALEHGNASRQQKLSKLRQQVQRLEDSIALLPERLSAPENVDAQSSPSTITINLK
jgi:predicted  nucleic acid-binding Zn-ribbon protein